MTTVLADLMTSLVCQIREVAVRRHGNCSTCAVFIFKYC